MKHDSRPKWDRSLRSPFPTLANHLVLCYDPAMRVIASLDDGASESDQARVRRQLTHAGFKPADTPEETAALGILIGEMPEDRFNDLQGKLRAGGIPGLASLDADSIKTIQPARKELR